MLSLASAGWADPARWLQRKVVPGPESDRSLRAAASGSLGEEALWCIGMVGVLRGLGLTLAEIQELAAVYLQPSDEPIGPRLAKVLGVVRERTQARIADLQSLLQRIEDFEVGHEAELGGWTDFELQDPRSHAGA